VDAVTITGDEVAAPARYRSGVTVALAAAAVLVTPFALLTATGLLTPIGVLAGLVAVSFAALVVVRTTSHRWPRRFAWALVVFSLLPWGVTVAYFITISFFDALPAGSSTP
jgi:hypothetical protein